MKVTVPSLVIETVLFPCRNSSSGISHSNHEVVELLCENSMMSTVLDHFGNKIKPKQIDKEHFSVSVEVSVSPTFFAWVFEFGGKIKILSPQCAIDEYVNLLKKSLPE